MWANTIKDCFDVNVDLIPFSTNTNMENCQNPSFPQQADTPVSSISNTCIPSTSFSSSQYKRKISSFEEESDDSRVSISLQCSTSKRMCISNSNNCIQNLTVEQNGNNVLFKGSSNIDNISCTTAVAPQKESREETGMEMESESATMEDNSSSVCVPAPPVQNFESNGNKQSNSYCIASWKIYGMDSHYI